MSNVVWTFEQKHKLARTRRRLSEGGRLLLAQQKRVFMLRARGHPAAAAQRLLDIFADSQLAMYAAHSARQGRRWR